MDTDSPIVQAERGWCPGAGRADITAQSLVVDVSQLDCGKQWHHAKELTRMGPGLHVEMDTLGVGPTFV